MAPPVFTKHAKKICTLIKTYFLIHAYLRNAYIGNTEISEMSLREEVTMASSTELQDSLYFRVSVSCLPPHSRNGTREPGFHGLPGFSPNIM